MTMKKIPRMSCKLKGKDYNKEDFNLELSFAKKYVKGEVVIEDFPYYKSYVNTLRKEQKYLKGDRLVVGCGPMPITNMILSNRVDGVDSSKVAVNSARKVMGTYLFAPSTIFHTKAEHFMLYGVYDSILLTLEAGTTLKKKEAILKHIHANMNYNATLVVRSSNTEEFINTDLINYNSMFKVIKRIPIFNNLSQSIILKKQ